MGGSPIGRWLPIPEDPVSLAALWSRWSLLGLFGSFVAILTYLSQDVVQTIDRSP